MTQYPTQQRKKSVPYLNNKDLLAETLKSLDQNEMTSKLASMLFKLVTRLSNKGNFTNYTYKEDMQGYALMMLVSTWKSFDPKKSDNAFAFFTQCVKNSFIQYLNKERKQRDIRDEMLIKQGLAPSYTYVAAQEEQQSNIEDEEDFEYIQRQHKKINVGYTETEEEQQKGLISF